MFAELRELLRSGAIRRHQLGAKDLLTPTSSYESDNEDTYLDQVRICNIHWHRPPFFRPEGEAPPFMEGRPPFMYSAFP